MVLQGQRIEQGFPARTKLTHRLEATVITRVVETALACKHHAVLDSHETALQHGFRFDLAGGVALDLVFVQHAHQKDCTRFQLGGENLVHVAAYLGCKFLDRGLRDDSLQLAKVQLQGFQLALVVVENAIYSTVKVIALAGALGPVCKLCLGEHEPAQLHLEVADIVLQGTLRCVLTLGV